MKERLDEYLCLDAPRRIALGTNGPGAWLFQPHKNHQTLVHNKPLSQRQVQKIVARWADYARVGILHGYGHISPSGRDITRPN